MKRIISLLLALTFIVSAFALTSCDGGEGDGKNTGDGTVGTNDGSGEPDATDAHPVDDDYMEDFFPYDGKVIPDSIANHGWLAPDATSVFFYVDAQHVIHDGKGTWDNMTDRLPTNVFDMDAGTFYDCDESDSTQNNDAMNVGIPYSGTAPFPTGYVGAYIEDGIYLTSIRWFGRAENPDRNAGGVFQASVDGETWVDLYTITRNSSCRDYEVIHTRDLPESCAETLYHYVRYVSPESGFCNIAEIELWGRPAK